MEALKVQFAPVNAIAEMQQELQTYKNEAENNSEEAMNRLSKQNPAAKSVTD